MVDFNNDTTVTTPALDVVKILILQRRNDVIEAFEHYNKSLDFEEDISLVRSRLYGLYLETKGMLENNFPDETLKTLREAVYSPKSFKEIDEGFNIINMLLYEIKLIKIDNKKGFDSRDMEAENKHHGI